MTARPKTFGRLIMRAAPVFNGPVDLATGFNELTVHYVGNVSTALDIDVTLGAGPHTTPAALAAGVVLCR